MSTASRFGACLAVLGLWTAASCAQRARSEAPPPESPARGRAPDATIVPPPQPAGGSTTIAPFPVPGDTSAEQSLRRKMLNLPKFGDYVYVTELPVAIERAAPVYPDAARERGVSGTVMVQALVLADGSVAETRIVRSIPELDTAAAEAVRKWRFKPAMNGQVPVAVWVATPIKFSLH